MILAGGAYVAGRLIHDMTKSVGGRAYDAAAFNMTRQNQLERMSDQELEALCGFKIDPKCRDYDKPYAIQTIAKIEGWNYYDSNALLHTPAYCKIQGYKQQGEARNKVFWESYNRLMEQHYWRFECPHGKDVPVSPVRFRSREGYFNAVKREYYQWRTNANFIYRIMGKAGYDYLLFPTKKTTKHLTLSEIETLFDIYPADYDSPEEMVAAAKEISKRYEKYAVFRNETDVWKKGSIKNDIKTVERMWQEHFDGDDPHEKTLQSVIDLYVTYATELGHPKAGWSGRIDSIFKELFDHNGWDGADIIARAKETIRCAEQGIPLTTAASDYEKMRVADKNAPSHPVVEGVMSEEDKAELERQKLPKDHPPY